MKTFASFSAMKKKSIKQFVSGSLVLALTFFSFRNASACDASFIDSIYGTSVALYNTSTASSSAYWYWTFGDGTWSDLKNPTHTYNGYGPYVVCLTVYDTANNCTDTYCDSIYFFWGNFCDASFTTTVSGTTVYFNNTSQPSSTVQWYWTFGDGGTSDQKNPVHTYSSNSFFYVCLAMTDTVNNCSDSICFLVNVTGNNPCIASFMAADSGTFVSFTNLSQADSSAYWYWTFGDNTWSDLKNPTHQYNGNGPYVVCLTVYDTANNCTDTYCDSVYLNYGNYCNAAFSYNASGTNLHFLNYSSYCNSPNWYWTFGDGGTSTNFDPWHQYSSIGYYQVCLYLTDNTCGCSDSVCQTVYAGTSNTACDASFILIADSSQQGLYYGYNYSTGSNLIYYWSWGDGTFSTDQYPTHTYADSGFYTICLAVYDTISGCGDSLCTNYYILKQMKMSGIHEIIFVNTTVVPPLADDAVDWKLFPNPAGNNFKIESHGKIDQLLISDLSGRTIHIVNDYNGKDISLNSFTQGAYMVHVLIDNRWYSKLLMKQ